MATPYDKLIDDHRNLRKLLRFLREEIGHYDDPDVDTDLARVREALDYLGSYPETYHHPLEEAAFDVLEQKNVGDTAVIEKIRGQHIELGRATAELTRTLDLIYSDHAVPVDTVKAALNQYLDLQFTHLECEDKDIFPLFEKALSSDDWERIAAQVDPTQDALFYPSSIETYRELSDSLGLS